MVEKTKLLVYRSYGWDELDAADRELIGKAREATLRSYAPYSRFRVGAAVRLACGQTVAGSNQENVAFGAGTCAERCAMFYANSLYPDEGITAIAIAARGTDGELTEAPVPPCGLCRQALLEAQVRAGHPIRVLLFGRAETLVVENLADLLPIQFDAIV